MQTVVATARRSLLIKEVLDEAAFRSSVADDVEKQRYDAGARAVDLNLTPTLTAVP